MLTPQLKYSRGFNFCEKKGFFIDYSDGMKLITSKKHKLQYLSIQKNASITLQFYFFELLKKNNEHPRGFFSDGKFIKNFKKNYKHILIIRDPVERFISALNYPILQNRNFSEATELGIKEKMRLNKSFIINNINKLQKFDFLIFRHITPQIDFIQKDLTYFEYIFSLHNLNKLNKILNKITKKNFLFKHFNNSKNYKAKLTLNDLSSNDLDILYNFYKEDYKFLRDFYSFDSLYKKWRLKNN